MKTDVEIRDEGTLVLFDLRTPEARSWWLDHVAVDGIMWHTANVVETRFAAAIIEGMHEAGLRIE